MYGKLVSINGYLVYKIVVSNDDHDYKKLLVDAGSGEVLYVTDSKKQDSNKKKRYNENKHDKKMKDYFKGMTPEQIAEKKKQFKEMGEAWKSLSIQDKASMIKQHDDLAVQKILLADDNELNRMIVQKMLQNRGHTVNLAQNGEEAIFMAQQQHYDIILMDINMPFVDGIEATKGIKKLSKSRAAIPVIALTASTKQEIIQECLKVGMVDYLLKPIEKEKLFDAIYHFGKKSDDLGAREAVQKTDLAYTKARNEKFETLVEEFGEEYAIDLCRQFIDAIEEKLLEIDTYISANDYDAIYRVAHDLSGMVGNIGLEESLERARKLEMASSKKTGDFPVLKKELSDCFCLEKQWLNSYVEQKS